MVAYGWTLEHLNEACRYVSNLLIKEGGVGVEVIYPEIKTYNCNRGNCTISFTLRFDSSTKRRKDGSYPAGSAYTQEWGSRILPKQPIPTAEVQNMRYAMSVGNQGREYEDVLQSRSTSSLCWHSFGHFMAKLFDLNPTGKLRTGANIYDTREGFVAKAGVNKNSNKHECDCWEHGIVGFFEVRE